MSRFRRWRERRAAERQARDQRANAVIADALDTPDPGHVPVPDDPLLQMQDGIARNQDVQLKGCVFMLAAFGVAAVVIVIVVGLAVLFG